MNENIFTLPLVPLRGLSVFPGMILHFDVGRPKSIDAVEAAMRKNKLIFLCYQKDIMTENPMLNDLAQIGTICEVRQILRLPDGAVRVLVEGKERGKILSYNKLGEYVSVEVKQLDDIVPIDEGDDMYLSVLMRRVEHLTEEFLELYDKVSPDAINALLSIDNPGELADVIASNLPIKPALKQTILDTLDVSNRLEELIKIMSDEIDILDIEKKVMEQVNENLDRNQREYVLREKLKVIKTELGEDDDSDIEKYKKLLDKRTLPEELMNVFNEELSKLSKVPTHSQEYAVIQGYIETLLALPWDKSSEEKLSVTDAKAQLDRDHFGLDKVKERILEYIAVRKLTDKPSGNILCLVGPPGTGKTSIVNSLAKSIGREYVRISLGGLHNEAEIRGHRKTYVGAMPGRIIDALKRAEVNNPIILLDEIDKMAKDYNGDPSSAMLEVLDPEQNKSFRDNYVEVPFDLSNVMFIASANTLDSIPRPLIDRMDIIEVSGYTDEEKLTIAKRYLVPKQRKKNGLSASQIKFTDSGLKLIISGYTRESGVRNLERTIAKICRKTAVKVVDNKNYSVSIAKKNLSEFLGKQIYHTDTDDVSAKNGKIGAATGLAWTEVGGETLTVEVNIMDGSGKLELTGNLGDVMKESAKAALSYIRTNCYKLGVDSDFYKTKDIHIHIPEGAVPKDGPSAGITMASAMISALSGFPLRSDTAMTGEVTLRGRVLPIGGLKEKTLAAYRIGIKNIIIPFDNKADYDELPDVVKDNITFYFAKNMDEVTNHAFLKHPRPIIPIAPASNVAMIKSDSVIHIDKKSSDVSRVKQ